MGQPGFATNTNARTAFSKLRSAIAGVYVYRKKYEEAASAFRQAMELCPQSPEASFRLAKMYEELGDIDQARAVMIAFVALGPSDSGVPLFSIDLPILMGPSLH